MCRRGTAAMEWAGLALHAGRFPAGLFHDERKKQA